LLTYHYKIIIKNKLLLLLTTLSLYNFAQNCKYEKNEIDKFTKKKVVITKREKLFSTFNTAGFCTIKQEGYQYFIEFDYSVQTSFSGESKVDKNIAIKEKDQFMFLLANDEVVTLNSSKTVKTEMKPNLTLGLVFWELNDAIYPITKEQLLILKNAKTKTLRNYRSISSDGQNFGQQDFMDVEIKKGNQDDIQKMINYVLQ